MTMVMENQSRQFGAMGYDQMYPHGLQATSPHFNDPWSAHSAANASNSTYSTAPAMQPQQKQDRPTAISLPYSSIPVSAPSLVAGSSYPAVGYGSTDLLSVPQDIPRSTYAPDRSYTTTSPATSAYHSTAYPPMSYAQSLQQHQQQQQQHSSRKNSNDVENTRASQATFGELDSARGMLALSHQNVADLTPRNIFEARAARGSTDSYGFPSHASSVSSISSQSGNEYPYYSAPSVASVDSATDYSSAASDGGYDSVNSRTLPPPPQLLGAHLPPAPQSMMGQFSSKMSSNTQKKHKCKVCDKRFTRPSSLQTHMYSHTGEKPYACDVEGCGRHFSVVSNLRRHKKVHKNGDIDHSHSESED